MKRLLFIAHRMPYPPDKGERLRALHEIKALSKEFHITLASLAFDEKDYAAARELERWCGKVICVRTGRKSALVRVAVGVVGGGSATESFFHKRSLSRRLAKEARKHEFSIVFGYSSSMLQYVQQVPATAKVIDLVDADSAKWSAYADDASWPLSWLYRREQRLVQRLEQDAVAECDSVVLVSQAESDVLGPYTKSVLPVANGVDTDYFSPMEYPDGNDCSLVFSGTMDYRPNADGVCWFVEHVWPLLLREMPDLTFTVVGRNPTRDVRRLSHSSGVTVTGSVPDVRPYLARAAVSVCPLRIARGIQNKVLEAMAMARPVVASPAALEGLEVKLGENALQADTPQQWRQAILRLIADQPLRRAMGEKARQWVMARYDWNSCMEPLVETCRQLTHDGATQAVGLSAGKSHRQPGVASRPRVRSKSPSPAKRSSSKELWIVAMIYVAGLIGASLLQPGTSIPLLGRWDATLSPEVQNALHAPAYGFMMVLISLALSASMQARLGALVVAGLTCFGFGLLMEFLQTKVGRVGSIDDALHNGKGIVIAGIGMLAWWVMAHGRERLRNIVARITDLWKSI